jgi:anaerobic magnesium-protoporphyrin IX monomethyl ester cyclase
MTRILLIYPYFRPKNDRSVFRFPPLGLAYLASVLKTQGHLLRIVDCTFMSKKDALLSAKDFSAEIIGIYCMSGMLDDCLFFARQFRDGAKLLIAGGPLPTCDPEIFLSDFDIVVRGEGELTLLEVVRAYESGGGYENIDGIVFREPLSSGKTISTKPRQFVENLDTLPFPARDLLPNSSYIAYGKRKNGFSITTIASTRGCPFECEFCSNVIFGGSYRERSAKNVVDEIERVLELGYDRISFTDDVFTLNNQRVIEICDEIRKRNLDFSWECLGRVDSMDEQLAGAMKKAGCFRIFFGIESGSKRILKLMNKHISLDQARSAVLAASKAGIETGAFFIIFYPGDTEGSILETLDFAASLPLDYLGLTPPYILPGTSLHDRILSTDTKFIELNSSISTIGEIPYIKDFSRLKMLFGIFKGKADHVVRKKFGKTMPKLVDVFERSTRYAFKLAR